MKELSYNPSVNIIKTVSTFLSSIATAIASFTSIATLVATVGGRSVVNIQGNEVIISLVFVALSLLVSLATLGLACLVLSLLPMVVTNELG